MAWTLGQLLKGRCLRLQGAAAQPRLRPQHEHAVHHRRQLRERGLPPHHPSRLLVKTRQQGGRHGRRSTGLRAVRLANGTDLEAALNTYRSRAGAGAGGSESRSKRAALPALSLPQTLGQLGCSAVLGPLCAMLLRSLWALQAPPAAQTEPALLAAAVPLCRH